MDLLPLLPPCQHEPAVEDQPENDDGYKPMEDPPPLTKEEAIQCTIELSKKDELAKWVGLDEAIELSMMYAVAPPAALGSTAAAVCLHRHRQELGPSPPTPSFLPLSYLYISVM
jgi:hypothetical protein